MARTYLVNFLTKIFKGKSKPNLPRTKLELFLDGLNPKTLDLQMKSIEDPLKVPYAQGITVLVFARIFTRGLPELSKSLPAPFKNDWPFPHDKIFAEVVGFYYSALLKDFFNSDDEDDDEETWNDDDGDEYKEKPKNPYFVSLLRSLDFCSKLIHSMTQEKISEKFVQGRAISYCDTINRKGKVVEAFRNSIIMAWNPNDNRVPVLSLSVPYIAVESEIACMPIDDVLNECSRLFHEKSYAR